MGVSSNAMSDPNGTMHRSDLKVRAEKSIIWRKNGFQVTQSSLLFLFPPLFAEFDNQNIIDQ